MLNTVFLFSALVLGACSRHGSPVPPYGDGLPPGEQAPGDSQGNLTPPDTTPPTGSNGPTLQLNTSMKLVPGA